MPAYWLARARVIDPAEYRKYTDRIPTIMKKCGGRIAGNRPQGASLNLRFHHPF